MSKKIIVIMAIVVVLVGLGLGALVWINQQSDEPNSIAKSEKNCTTYNGIVDEQCSEDYTGLPVNEAGEKAEENGLFPKVAVRDGEGQITTDEGSTPIYFEVEDGVVVKAYFEHNR
jgi:uncharacterized protein YxeA